MAVLRFLLTVTWATWIWLELMAVAGPVVLDRVRGRGQRQEGRSAALLLASAGAAFVIAVRIARLPVGALPGPPEVALAGGLAVMWGGLAVRAWSFHQVGGLFRWAVPAHQGNGLAAGGQYRYLRHPAAAGALVAASGFGVALAHWTSLLVLVAGWSAGIAFGIRVGRD